MNRILLSFLLCMAVAPLSAQLPDGQVVDMLRQMRDQGMDQQQIAVRLADEGVTREQLLRIKAQMEGGNADPQAPVQDQSRVRLSPPAGGPQTPTPSVRGANSIFGHGVFNNSMLTFEPSLNIATPENYVLGPGDEVIVDVWGDSEQTIRQVVSPDGNIVVSQIGPVYLNGLTIAEANARLRKSFMRIYSGIGSGGTFVKTSLGQIRSIQVHVMGEVIAPGTYTVPSLATLFHVLYNAGGVNPIGSLRDIRVNRNGVQAAAVDIYRYLMEGRSDQDVGLKDGDVVIVPPYTNLVSVAGNVKRPMKYELRDGETLASLLRYSGGFAGDAYTTALRVIRNSGRERQVYNVPQSDYGSFTLTDGDEVSVGSMLDRFENMVEVRGAVFRPGLYATGERVSTVRELVTKAEGLREDVFANRAELYRRKADRTMEVLAVDIGAVMSGAAPDVALQKDDVLHIPSIFDLREDYTFSVSGAVGAPGNFPYADNTTLEDAVVSAGGLLESASTVRVDVARRVRDPESTDENAAKAVNFTFALKDGLVVRGERGFVLQPFDAVYVRTSPGYSAQQNVSVDGEVLFSGQYALSTRNERLSDLVRKAGGLTSGAYVAGARLLRRMTSDEHARLVSAVNLTRNAGTDSLSVQSLNISQEYAVGIELDKALAAPGSDHDLTLREGDRLVVPEYMGTVKVSGAVTYPNTVAYHDGASLKHYVGQGGGYAHRAFRRKVYVVHMNGTVQKSGFLFRPRISPGCEVIVPMKAAPRRDGMSLPEIMSLGASTTSIAALVTSIINMSK